MAKAPCGCEVYGTRENPNAALGVSHFCDVAERLRADVARAQRVLGNHIGNAKAAVREAEEQKP